MLTTVSSGLNATLQWLVKNESTSGPTAGSYGSYNEHGTAAAAYALWLNDSNSAKAALSYTYLASQLNGNCPNSWFWKSEPVCTGEADIPGAVLYSIDSASYSRLVNETSVSAQTLRLQQASGGFQGYCYYNSVSGTCPVGTSSVDTDMALLGLISSNLLPVENRTLAVSYLLSLQNQDGSFNLTRSQSFDPIYSLGPEPTSITALTLLALKSDGFTNEEAPISNGLRFLIKANQAAFGGNGHVYSAAMSVLAFKAYDQPDSSTTAVVYILSQQNSDGGYSDSSRYSYPHSNALDTGWAAIAIETHSSEEIGSSSSINSPPTADFSFDPQDPTTGTIVTFNASTSFDPDADQLAYAWTFGDGSNAEGVSPTHTYTASGNFTVTLTVTDSGTNPGPLSDTESVNITVQPSTVQGSSTIPPSRSSLWVIAGGIGSVAAIGVAFVLGRKTAQRRVLPGG